MTTIRTTLNLRKREARHLMDAGYEIQHIATRHLDTGDEGRIVWTSPARADDIPDNEIPY